MCLGLQNATKISRKPSGSFFLANFTLPFADCHLGMTIAVKLNKGEEPFTAGCAYRNGSSDDLRRHRVMWRRNSVFDEGVSPNHNANTMYMFYHCCIQMVDKKWPLPPLSSNLWMVCCMKPVSWTGQRLPHACMFSLNLSISKSCLTSVLIWPLSLHLTSLTGVQISAQQRSCQHWRPNCRTAYKRRLRRCSIKEMLQGDSYLGPSTMSVGIAEWHQIKMATMSPPVDSNMYVHVALDRRAQPGVSNCRKRGFLLISCLLPSIPWEAAPKGKIPLTFATKIDFLRWVYFGFRVERSLWMCFFHKCAYEHLQINQTGVFSGV